MEQLILEIISRHIRDKKLIKSNQHSFTKGNSCWTNLLIFYDEITGLIDEARAVDSVYLDFSKVFDTVSSKILINKLLRGLDEQTVRWIENWLNVWAWRVMISGTKASWRPIASSVPPRVNTGSSPV